MKGLDYMMKGLMVARGCTCKKWVTWFGETPYIKEENFAVAQ